MSPSNRSVFATNGLCRHQRRLMAGIAKVRGGEAFRTGSERAHLSINDFFAKYHHDGKQPMYKNTTLTWSEEREIVRILLEQDHAGGFISFESIKRETSMFVQSLPTNRQRKIRFKNLCPSKTFCSLFQKRHCYAIYCGNALRHAGMSAPLLTAKQVVSYFKDIRRMIVKDGLHPDNIWCLSCRTEPVEFGRDNSIVKFLTILSVANASGRLLSYIHFVHHDDFSDAVSSSTQFKEWISHVAVKLHSVSIFAVQTSYPYHLLLCDESYEFVNCSLRQWLFDLQIIVYSVGGLSGGNDDNHDVGCSALWGTSFVQYLGGHSQLIPTPKASWTEQTLATFTQLARYTAFTPRNISDSFANAGIFPLDEVRFFKRPRPLCLQYEGKICDMEAICNLLDAAEASSDEN